MVRLIFYSFLFLFSLLCAKDGIVLTIDEFEYSLHQFVLYCTVDTLLMIPLIRDPVYVQNDQILKVVDYQILAIGSSLTTPHCASWR